jgi:PUA domain protein
MFKKFTAEESVSGYSQAKSSVTRGIKAKVIEQYPEAEKYMDSLIPRKEPLGIIKCHDHIELLTCQGELLFFRYRDGPYIPTLRLLHQYPTLLPWVQVDKGAIKFILSGANIMCPGLTSPGANLPVDLPEEASVAVMAEGKQHAVAIGKMKLSTDDMLVCLVFVSFYER